MDLPGLKQEAQEDLPSCRGVGEHAGGMIYSPLIPSFLSATAGGKKEFWKALGYYEECLQLRRKLLYLKYMVPEKKFFVNGTQESSAS